MQRPLAGDMVLIKEMKTAKSGCRASTELPDNVGGAEGEKEICEKFRKVGRYHLDRVHRGGDENHR